MLMHYIVRTLIFQHQYFMKECNQLVIGDKSKYLNVTLIHEEQKTYVFVDSLIFHSSFKFYRQAAHQVWEEQKEGAFRTAAVSINVTLDFQVLRKKKNRPKAQDEHSWQALVIIGSVWAALPPASLFDSHLFAFLGSFYLCWLFVRLKDDLMLLNCGREAVTSHQSGWNLCPTWWGKANFLFLDDCKQKKERKTVETPEGSERAALREACQASSCSQDIVACQIRDRTSC